jgi:hypothetical protein
VQVVPAHPLDDSHLAHHIAVYPHRNTVVRGAGGAIGASALLQKA